MEIDTVAVLIAVLGASSIFVESEIAVVMHSVVLLGGTSLVKVDTESLTTLVDDIVEGNVDEISS